MRTGNEAQVATNPEIPWALLLMPYEIKPRPIAELRLLTSQRFHTDKHPEQWRNQVGAELNVLLERASAALMVGGRNAPEPDRLFAEVVVRIAQRVGEFDDIILQ